MHKYYTAMGFDPFEYMPETHLVPLVKNFEQSEPFLNFLARSNQKAE